MSRGDFQLGMGLTHRRSRGSDYVWWTVPLFALFVFPNSVPQADAFSRMKAPFSPHVVPCNFGDHYLKLVPIKDSHSPDLAIGRAYAYWVQSGTDSLLWSMETVHYPRLHLGHDGKSLVRVNEAPSGRMPRPGDWGVILYYEGRKVGEYTTRDLILEPNKFRRPGHQTYQWLDSTRPSRFVGPSRFAITTLEKREIEFDCKSGRIVENRELEIDR